MHIDINLSFRVPGSTKSELAAIARRKISGENDSFQAMTLLHVGDAFQVSEDIRAVILSKRATHEWLLVDMEVSTSEYELPTLLNKLEEWDIIQISQEFRG